ncbi:hypothetical protein [Legionella shakespearei]|uniref:Conjugative transfer protein n=1 Tax=Legionella shakespearei DSM 23087 TaxID=1122169 RepID=A0A0W0Z8H5_9GAMM|nr:hypothetical protein [Legionella shakespearei]KTD65110.1 hypothetical protein Lsha_0479 [Legionella shakespearei DSM 23087]
MFRYLSVLVLSAFLASGSVMAAQDAAKSKACGKILVECWKKAVEINCYPSPLRPDVCKKFKKQNCSTKPSYYKDFFNFGKLGPEIAIKCAGS